MSDSEIVREIEELISLPENVHWFCPRDSVVDEFANFFDEDLADILSTESPEERERRQDCVRQARERKAQVLRTCQILAFDGEQALALLERLKESLKHQLTRCTVCVREFHRGRRDLQHGLEEQYGGDVVDDFMRLFDKMNIERITTGLDQALATLQATPPSQRTIGILPPDEMYALFEAMHCTALLKDETLLQAHFDQPFQQVQTKRKITMAEYTPALVFFAFSRNAERLAWSLRGWKKSKRPLSVPDFDWAVRDTLTAVAADIKTYSARGDDLTSFWRGVHMIVGKLTKNLITHHFRALEVDIYMLALDHLQQDFAGYPDLIATVQILLEKSPTVFWDALGAIPPQTVATQPFSSPYLEERLLATQQERLEDLEALLLWVDPFIASIKASNLAPACRVVVNQLMARANDDRYPECARSLCWQKGMQAMIEALRITDKITPGNAVVADLLDIVGIHLQQVLGVMHKYKGKSEHVHETDLGLDLVRYALSLDCRSLELTRADILKGSNLGHDLSIASLTIWKAATGAVLPNDAALASAVLVGVQRMLVFEPLTDKQSKAFPKEAEAWNRGFGRASAYVHDLLERLQDFEPAHLFELLSSTESAKALFATIFSGHAEIHQAAATIVKAMTSAETRRDGIRHLIDHSFTVSLTAVSHTLNTIAQAKAFAPCRTVLRIGNDILDGLCSPQDGLLRSKTLSADDIAATEMAWQSLWTVMDGHFRFTEEWSLSGQDKNMMVEFCRDTMDFADQAFDQYSVITGALQNVTEDATDSTMQQTQIQLLQMPREASGHSTKWLRLRDEYLVAKIVSLTCRIMGRLRDVDLQLPEAATFYVDDIVSDTVRNKLTVGQKAELRRALESHLGHDPEVSTALEPEPQRPKKQGSISSWVKNPPPTTGAVPVVQGKASVIDLHAWKAAALSRKEDKARYDDLKRAASTATPTAELTKSRSDFLASRTSAVKKASQAPQVSISDFRRKRLEEQEAFNKRRLAVIAAQKAKTGLGDAGSGLSGIGIAGKDPSTKGEGVMVSSDESSDDEDGGFDAELFGVSKSAKRTNMVKKDASGAIGLKPEQRGPVKLHRQIRSAKDMRARLAPDLSPLHKTILGWDFFHEGEYPPNSNDWNFNKVAKSFRHVVDYQDTFRPLLTLESWHQFKKAREENTFKPFEIKIGSRSNVDAFIEIGSFVSHADNRELSISESDIILFSKADVPTASPEVPHCLAQVYRIRRQKQHIEITYRVLPKPNMVTFLTPGNVLHGAKITSITPLEREYGALLGLQYYDLCDEIIKARPSPLLKYTDKQLQPLIENYTVNKAQAKAVRSAMDNDAFTLIQGPPGTGKTKTIVAIVGAILSDTLGDKQITTRIQIPKGAVTNASSSTVSKKLLVCAPSNAAVDELVMRFKAGVRTLRGVHKELNIVRLGRSDAINSNVVDVTMDELVKKRLGQTNGDRDVREKTQLIMKEHQAVSEQLRQARARLDNGEAKGKEATQLQDDFNALRRRKMQLGTQIDNAKDAEASASRTADLNRKRVQQAVLDDAHVICATLSGSGHDMFQSLNIEVETVIVDEAAQCVELNALIPLKYGCAKCILVGDPKQLPPTVFSRKAAALLYEQSLFVRMQNNFPDSVHLLDTQYRMHPDISSFPSASFYDGRLLDGENMAELRQQPWHASDLLGPYRFFDVKGQHQAAPKGHSLINLAEIDVAMQLYERLTRDYHDYDFKNKIGIITPYKSQLRELKQRFANRYGEAILEVVDFNTTDAFQGRESEVIIFSCVRAHETGGVGFLSDIRRMNVGITRAKSSLWILGNSQSLARGEYWNKMLIDAEDRDCLIGGDLRAKLQRPSSHFPAKARPKSKQLMTAGLGALPLVAPAESVSLKAELSDMPLKVGSVKTETPYMSSRPTSLQTRPHADAMEGVKVKLEDRISSLRAGTVIPTKSSAPEANGNQDVIMQDASAGPPGGAATGQNTFKVADTDRTGPEAAGSKDPATKASSSSDQKPKVPLMPGKAAPPVIRKRKPAASAFLPAPNRKQQKRAP